LSGEFCLVGETWFSKKLASFIYVVYKFKIKMFHCHSIGDSYCRQILAASGESILIQEETGIGHKDGLALALKTTVCTNNFDIFFL